MDLKRQKELAGITSPTELQKVLNENLFGRAGYGGEKDQSQQILSELAQMLRDAKVFLRDGNTKDAAMLVDRAYSRVADYNRGEK